MGSFIREKPKKIGFVWSLCRVPKHWAHGEPINFAVCQSTGHTAKNSAVGPRVTKFAVCLSRWHTAK